MMVLRAHESASKTAEVCRRQGKAASCQRGKPSAPHFGCLPQCLAETHKITPKSAELGDVGQYPYFGQETHAHQIPTHKSRRQAGQDIFGLLTLG